MSFFHGCAENRSFAVKSRRNFLQLGAIGSLGLTLQSALKTQAEAAPGSRGPKAKSVILLWLQGGVSHHESFDPKPDAPANVRGEFGTIPTKLAGVHFGEHLPRLSQLADQLAVIRSVTHAEAAHERGSMYMVEGRRPAAATGTLHSGNPQLGCMVAHELGVRNGLPAFFSLPGNDFTSRFLGTGWLPEVSGPFKGYQSSSLASGGGGDANVIDRRASLREALEGNAFSIASGAWDRFDRQALEIITSGKGAAAFDMTRETEETRRLYGWQPKGNDDMATFCLTARRLVEAGTRFVTIGRDSWDHHSNIFPQIRSRMPLFDAAFSGLLIDLQRRGMLEETLVVYLTEYGRTPKINAEAGRDHWPAAFSVAFAGAGIRAGQVLGASDREGAQVTDRPVSPEEIAATILHLAGVDPHKWLQKPDGRPIQYVDSESRPIQEILA